MVGSRFGDFFAAVEKTQPELTLQVNAICCARVPEWLNQNEVDIGFVQMLNTQESEGQQIVPLFQERLCLMTSPESPAGAAGGSASRDLNREKFLLYL